jgi:hypothetical protein
VLLSTLDMRPASTRLVASATLAAFASSASASGSKDVIVQVTSQLFASALSFTDVKIDVPVVVGLYRCRMHRVPRPCRVCSHSMWRHILTNIFRYGYVQTSPPQETITGTQWWTDYQVRLGHDLHVQRRAHLRVAGVVQPHRQAWEPSSIRQHGQDLPPCWSEGPRWSVFYTHLRF